MEKKYLIGLFCVVLFIVIVSFLVLIPTLKANNKVDEIKEKDKEIKEGVLRFSVKFFDEPKKVCFTQMEMESITDQENKLVIRPLSVLANIDAKFRAYCPSYLSGTEPIYTTRTSFNLWTGKSTPKTTQIIKNLPEGDRCKIVGELNCEYCDCPCSKEVIYVNIGDSW